MKDYIELGPSPVEEDCKQMGRDPQEELRAECGRFKDLLEKVLPVPAHLAEQDVRYAVKFFPYDAPAGGYYEVVLHYDRSDEEQTAFAYKVEGETPLRWEQ